MARQRKLSPERKAFISGLLEHYQPQDAQDFEHTLKDAQQKVRMENRYSRILINNIYGMLKLGTEYRMPVAKLED